AAPVLAALGLDPALELQVDQRAHPAVRAQQHLAAVSPISSRRATVRPILLAEKGDAWSPAITAFHVHFDFVEEFQEKSPRPSARGGFRTIQRRTPVAELTTPAAARSPGGGLCRTARRGRPRRSRRRV